MPNNNIDKDMKEELFKKHKIGQNNIWLASTVMRIEDAMDEYAELLSIEFICWAVQNHSVDFEGFSLNFFRDGSVKIFVNHEEITIQQLFQLFLQHKQSLKG